MSHNNSYNITISIIISVIVEMKNNATNNKIISVSSNAGCSHEGNPVLKRWNQASCNSLCSPTSAELQRSSIVPLLLHT